MLAFKFLTEIIHTGTSGLTMADIANRDAAEQSLDIARAALAANNLDKAQKFVDKAMKLYPSDEVHLLVIIRHTAANICIVLVAIYAAHLFALKRAANARHETQLACVTRKWNTCTS